MCQDTIDYCGLEFVCGDTMYICAGVAPDHVCQNYYRLLVIGLLLCVMSQRAIFAGVVPDRLCHDTIDDCDRQSHDLCTNDTYAIYRQSHCAGFCKLCDRECLTLSACRLSDLTATLSFVLSHRHIVACRISQAHCHFVICRISRTHRDLFDLMSTLSPFWSDEHTVTCPIS